MTLTQLSVKYQRKHGRRWKKPRSVETDAYLWATVVLPILGCLDLEDLTYKRIEAWHFAQQAHPVRANRALALLSAALNCAMRWGDLEPRVNPCTLVRRNPERPRQEFLDEAGWRALWGALGAWAGSRPEQVAVIALLALTGARLGEWLHARWEWIDRDPAGWLLRLPDSKTGAKVVHIPSQAQEVLQARPGRQDQGPIFPGVSVHRTWNRIRAEIGHPTLRLHDLRHSFVAAGLARGASLEQMGELLGHRSVSTTKRYAHLATEEVRRVGKTAVLGMFYDQKSED